MTSASDGELAREDHLERDGAVEADLPRLVDDPHAAAGELVDQLIIAEVADVPRPVSGESGWNWPLDRESVPVLRIESGHVRGRAARHDGRRLGDGIVFRWDGRRSVTATGTIGIQSGTCRFSVTAKPNPAKSITPIRGIGHDQRLPILYRDNAGDCRGRQ